MTGKGPLKEHFSQIFKQRNDETWKKTNAKMAWLEVDDYPKMVAASDLGVCLHYSSSGLDLPMKVVDMFSAGLPCLAKDFEAVGELVRDRFNGRLFRDSKELAQ